MSFKSCLHKSTARLVSFFFLLLIFGAVGVFAEQVKDLKPQGYVNDFAGVLSASAKEKLTALCAEVDRKAGAQIAIVTVSSLGGEPIEQFSIELATQWGIGPKQQARGALILLAPTDRKYRVEVGYGLEPILPDGKVGGFGREMAPLLQRNDYDGAVTLITERIASVIAADRGVTLETATGPPAPSPESGDRKSRAGILIPATANVDRRLVWAEVVAAGPTVRTIEPTDRVLFSPDTGFEVEIRGEEYLILRERDVHAIASTRAEGQSGLYL